MKIKSSLILSLMVLFLGFNLSLAGTWQELETQFAPSARSSHIAIYDPGSRSMVVMGDEDCLDSNVHYLDLRTQKWIVQGSSDTIKRAGQSVVYDSSKNRAIIFGGSVLGKSFLSGFDNKTYTWAFDNTSWDILTSTGTTPLARIDHSAIYDTKNNRMIIFGGKGNDGNYKNDLYALDLSQTTPSWSQLNPTGATPSARGKHTTIYDPHGQRMLIFGGTSILSQVNDDIYSLDLTTLVWTKLSPGGTSSPAERTGHTAVYDPNTGSSGSMIIFGGTNPLTEQYMNDTYILDLSQLVWARVQPGLNTPAGRSGHTAIYDTDNKRMIIFGGYNGTNNLNNCHTLNVIDLWPPASPKEEVFNYPNPFAAGVENTHICFYLDNGANVSISIFTLVGDLVKKWSVNGQKGINELLWDGRNGEGELVENGGYICVIKKPNTTAKFKIAILK